MLFKNKIIFFLLIFHLTLWSCNEKKEVTFETTDSTVQEMLLKSSSETKLANLEEIPFDLPDDWIYTKVTEEQKKNSNFPETGYQGRAENPLEPFVAATVWKYPVDNLTDLLPLFKKDIEKLLGLTVEYKVEDDIVYGITLQAGEKFLWKANYIRKNEELVFVAVGSRIDLYDEKLSSINGIFNSIN